MPFSRRGKRIWAAVLVALPISIVAIVSLAYDVSQLASPCVGWGGGNVRASTGASPCKQYTVDSRTRTQAARWLLGVQGGILLATALGIWGTVRSRQAMVIVAGLLILLEMIPLLFSFWPLALLAGAGLLLVACQMPD